MDVNETRLDDLRKEPRLILHIENPTDEMKWIALEKAPHLLHQINPNEEMLRWGFKNANESLIAYKGELPQFTRDEIKEAIRNIRLISDFVNKIILPNITMDKEIASWFIQKNFIYSTMDCIQEIYDDELNRVTIESFKINNDRYKHLPDFVYLNDDDWQYFINNNLATKLSFKNRTQTMPLFAKKHIIDESYYGYACIGNDKEALLYYLEKYKTQDLPWERWEFATTEAWQEVLKENGAYIAKLKNPNDIEKEIAIKNNPFNIQYIEKPTEADCLLAISLDINVAPYINKKTKKICKALNIPYEKENRFKEKYYYVTMKEDLADEGDLVRHMIVAGKDMPKFLSSTVSLSFGNLDDDKQRKISKIAKYKPITKEEIEILKKFNVDDIESGYWFFNDED